jgi:hypothetical protein
MTPTRKPCHGYIIVWFQDTLFDADYVIRKENDDVYNVGLAGGQVRTLFIDVFYVLLENIKEQYHVFWYKLKYSVFEKKGANKFKNVVMRIPQVKFDTMHHFLLFFRQQC